MKPQSMLQMLKSETLAWAAIGTLAMMAQANSAQPEVGRPAPDFAVADSHGKMQRLADYRGKTVVLEWTNSECPFVHKHYGSGNMQKTQNLAQSKNIAWLTVISSAPGKQGYVNGPAANALTDSRHALPTAVLLDPKGEVGRAYNAKTTPHVFVIDKDGILRYMGGMDNMATTDLEDIGKAEPYLEEAMLAVAAGTPVQNPVTKPYGCSIKY